MSNVAKLQLIKTKKKKTKKEQIKSRNNNKIGTNKKLGTYVCKYVLYDTLSNCMQSTVIVALLASGSGSDDSFFN